MRNLSASDAVHRALKDNEKYNQLGLDQKAQLCISIASQLKKNFLTSKELLNCIFYGFQEFSEVVNATANYEMR